MKTKIKVGDMFSNPAFVNSVVYLVTDIDKDSGLIKIQGYSSFTKDKIGPSFWKSSESMLFNEFWRVKE